MHVLHTNSQKVVAKIAKRCGVLIGMDVAHPRKPCNERETAVSRTPADLPGPFPVGENQSTRLTDALFAGFEHQLLDQARAAIQVVYGDVFVAGMVVCHARGKGDRRHAASRKDVGIRASTR